MRHPSIPPVRYRPAEDKNVELKSLSEIARRGGALLSRPQRPEFDLILWTRTATLGHDVDFQRFTLGPADLIWVRAGQVQQWSELTGIDGHALLFVGDALPLRRPIFIDAPNHWPDIRRNEPFVAQTLTLIELAWADETAHVALPFLVAALTAYLSTDAAETPTDSLYRQFVTAVESGFRQARSVDHYGRLLGYTSKTVNRATVAAVGATAKQVIDRRVILEAKRLLVHADTPVAAIADHLGFDDPANFSRYFKAQTGNTPREFRSRGHSSS